MTLTEHPVGAVPVTAPTASTIRVSVGDTLKRVDRAASGSLYGVADASRPSDRMLAAIRPKNVTQMCPGGEQVPNGEPRPSGDALVVADRCAAQGTSVTVRLADTYADFPYRWSSWADWESRVRRAVRASVASGAQNVYAYELWNEPNWTWDAAAAGEFADGWARTWRVVRDVDASTPVMGPSLDRWDAGWMREFLVAAQATGTVPDVISWHELDPADVDVEAHMGQFRRLERELGIDRRPVSINEYGPHRDMAVPGALAAWVARLERAGVDTANIAFWHRPGRLADLVTADDRPTGAWWVYRWYAQMTGLMLWVTGVPGGADAFAAADRDHLDVVVGGTSGDVDLVIDGLGATGRATRVWAEVEVARWTGTDGPLDEPERWFTGWLPVVDGVTTVVLRDGDPTSAYRVRLRWSIEEPGDASDNGVRVEADEAVVVGAVHGDRHASAHRYVFAEPGAGWSVMVGADRRPACACDVEVRYRNLSHAPATVQFLVDGSVLGTVTVPSGPDERFRTARATLGTLPSGTLMVTSSGEALEIDHLDLRPFRRRCEAEDGRIVRGSVFITDRSPAAFRAEMHSGRGQVVHLDEIGSSVEVEVRIPSDGPYTVTLGYTNGGVSSVQTICVDSVDVVSVHAVPTQAWGLVGAVSAELTLAAGLRRLKVRREGKVGYVSLDFVDVEAVDGRRSTSGRRLRA